MRVWSLLFVSGFLTLVAAACGSNGSKPSSTFPDSGVSPDGTTTDTGPLKDVMSMTLPEGSMGCVPKTCAELGYNCGPVANAMTCGMLINCGTCEAGTSCGGGGQHFVCGSPSTMTDAAPNPDACVPLTCQQQGFNCGMNGDGCGGIVNCGTCEAGTTCGGAGGFSVCGVPTTTGDEVVCTPQTCQSLGYTCGSTGDGCGGMLNCGTCTAPDYCGGGGFSKCGTGNETDGMVIPPPDSGVCVPKTCAELGYQCGPAGDGCGNVIQCGSCTAPQTCGGGGTAFKCGSGSSGGGDACVPKTCITQHYGCGIQGDGCGNTIDCGTCPSGQTCGGGGVDNQCGSPGGGTTPDAGCTNLCPLQTNCPVGLTTITGKVVAGTPAIYGTPDPVPNVTVYVPNSGVQPFTPGVSCTQCGADLSGDPLVQTTTAADGTFELINVPVTTNMPLVIQLGRWRRQFVIPQTTACVNTPVGTLTMPHNHMEGDIPLTAISTGNVDAMECVLLKMGVDASEFTLPAAAGGTGRIQLFVGNGANEGFNDPAESVLTASPAQLAKYDEVYFPCWGVDPTEAQGSSNIKPAAQQQNLINYTNMGGRMFVNHYQFGWLYNAPGFQQTAVWDPDTSAWPSVEANIDTSLPITQTFENWMITINATLPNGQFNVEQPRHDFNSVVAPAARWIYTPDHETFPLMYTFDTPYNASNVCGRVIFSDFHVTSNNMTSGVQFPNECNTSPMTPQEKALEYLIWALDTCVPPPPKVCQPLTCSEQGITCGPAGDGCGNLIQCGACPVPDAGMVTCVPLTCSEQNLSCGPAGDGCGNIIQCGSCTPPQTCGGGGKNGQCGEPPEGGFIDGSPGTCNPETCAQQNIGCGPAGDGCGNLIQCGNCTPPLTCGGGGVHGQCGSPDSGTLTCNPRTCAQLGFNCGPQGDGCGNIIQCGNCTPPQYCGGGGPGKCGAPDGSTNPDSCVPETCMQQGISCGPAGDGCGGQLNCGTCTSPQTCGGGGVYGQCGGTGNN